MSAVDMKILTSKYEVMELLFKNNNQKLIDAIKDALKKDNSSEDFYDELNDKDKTIIQQSKQDIENGDVYSHEEVMSEFRQKFQ
ncbi:MAG: hypothetical protein AB8G11_18435 [Saprospiraceae bacterium]